MAVPVPTARSLSTFNPHSPSHFTSLTSAITSCLQALNPQNPNPSSHITPAPLNQFSPTLNPQLVIDVINHQSNPYHALFFFNWASNPYPNPNSYSHTQLCYVAITDHLLSHSLFSIASSLLDKSNRFNDFLGSKFITACGNRGHIKGAIFWFHKAKSIEKGKCMFSYNAILNVLVNANQIKLARAFFEEMTFGAPVLPDASPYAIMIKGYCKLGMIEDARKVFDEMGGPNLVCYNTIINGYCKKGQMDEAMKMFHRLLGSKDCFPSTVTYTTLIDGYCKKGEFDEAMKWLDEMKLRGCNPNLLTYNAIIYSLCLGGYVNEAKKLMTEMRLNGVKENLATHMSILKGLCHVGKSDDAVNYLGEIIRKGMRPDEKAYGLVVNEYCKMRKPDEAITLLKKMRGEGIISCVSSFNSVFRLFMELGEFNRAIILLKQMQGMGCKPNYMSYNIVICGLCRARNRMGDVKELVNKMICCGLAIDASMYGSLIKGYCEDGDDEIAVEVFYEMVDKKYVLDRDSFSVFVKQLCEKGKGVEAEKLYKDLLERCSVVDVEGYKRILDEQLVAYIRRENVVQDSNDLRLAAWPY